MLNVLKNEPARVVSFVLAVIGVATSFGLGITTGQTAAIVALTGAGLALLGGEAVRAQVAPKGKLLSPASDLTAEPAPAADAPAPVAKRAPAKRAAKKVAPKPKG